jgi:uncharacterized lipoprotein YajG
LINTPQAGVASLREINKLTTNIGWFMKLHFALGVLLASALLTGCVTGTRNVDLAPSKHANDKTASGQAYINFVEDKRVFESKPASPSTPSVDGDLAKTSKDKLATLIGRQRNGYGMAMGDVALPKSETVQTEMKALLKEGLESRGYTVTDNKNAPVKLDVDIEKFWAWFSPGMFAVSFEANLACKINYADAQGSKVFEVAGYGLNKGQVASDANWALAYQRAFDDFLKNLDKKLDDAKL